MDARQAQQLAAELSHQTQTHHGRMFAKLRRHPPYSVQGRANQMVRGRILEAHLVRHLDSHVARNAPVAGVLGVAAAHAGYPRADRDVFASLSLSDHNTGVGVPERPGRAVPRLFALAFDSTQFGSRAHHARLHFDLYLARLRLRYRLLYNRDLPRSVDRGSLACAFRHLSSLPSVRPVHSVVILPVNVS